MYKICSLCILFCHVVSVPVFAQQKSRLGIKTGVNVAWQTNSMYGIQPGAVIAMHVTGFTEVQVAKRFFVQPGISLQGKGVSTDAGDQQEMADGRVNMMYLEIPINLLYKFNLPNLTKLVVGGGPYAGLGLNGKERNGSPNVFRGIAGTDGFTNTDFGFNLIVGTELKSRFSLSLQQSIGMDNVAPAGHRFAGSEGQSYLADIKNRVSSVSIGYRF